MNAARACLLTAILVTACLAAPAPPAAAEAILCLRVLDPMQLPTLQSVLPAAVFGTVQAATGSDESLAPDAVDLRDGFVFTKGASLEFAYYDYDSQVNDHYVYYVTGLVDCNPSSFVQHSVQELGECVGSPQPCDLAHEMAEWIVCRATTLPHPYCPPFPLDPAWE